MAKVYDEIRKLHAEKLFDDLKIVISLVLSRHAGAVSTTTNCSILSLTPFHLCQLNVFYADAWYSSGEFRKAEKYYKEALGLRRGCRHSSDGFEKMDLTSDSEVRYRLYKVYMALRQHKSAMHVLEAIPGKDRTIAVNMALGNLYKEEGMDRSAITAYKEVLRSCPLSVEAATKLLSLGVQRLNLASLMLNTLKTINDEDWLMEWINLRQHIIEKHWPASFERIQELDRICPGNLDVMSTKADIHYMYGQYFQAKIIWQELESGDHGMHRERLALLNIVFHFLDKKWSEQRKVIEADPLIIKNVEKMAYVQMDPKDHTGLARLCTLVADVNPALPEPWIVYGAYSLVTRKYNEAECLAQKVLSISPKFYAAHVLMGVALSFSDRTIESEQCLKEAIRLDPFRLEAYKELLKTYLRVSRVKDAITLGNTAIRQIGTTPSTLYIYGKALSCGTLAQRLKAKMYLEKAIQADPYYVQPVYTLADILSRQAKHKRVIHLLEQSLRDNNTPRLHQMYGDALFEVADRQKAMHHYGIALQLEPSNKRAKEGLERAEKKSEINSMDGSFVGDSLEPSSEIEVNVEGVDSLSWSDPELGY